MEVVYVGWVKDGAVFVTRNGHPLDPKPSLKAWNHSPTGFEWGYAGSGPAQLALALLLDALGNKELAIEYHQRYKFEFVAKWQRGHSWMTNRSEILAWIASKKEVPLAEPVVQAPTVVEPPPMVEDKPKRRRSE